jgi:hypothetical protein
MFNFAIPYLPHGTVAEWLGGGLQNLIQRFESARYLKVPSAFAEGDFLFSFN